MRGFLPHPDDVPVELALRPSPSLFRQRLHKQQALDASAPADLEALAQQWVSLHAGEFSEASLEATHTRQILV